MSKKNIESLVTSSRLSRATCSSAYRKLTYKKSRCMKWETVNELRTKSAQAVALLSPKGLDADLKMALRVSGIETFFGWPHS